MLEPLNSKVVKHPRADRVWLRPIQLNPKGSDRMPYIRSCQESVPRMCSDALVMPARVRAPTPRHAMLDVFEGRKPPSIRSRMPRPCYSTAKGGRVSPIYALAGSRSHACDQR
jgi:hypothetical protein